MLLKIHPENPEGRKIQQVVDILDAGGIIIYPTDTVYGIGCDIYNQEAVDRICKIRGLDPVKARLSFICKDISQITEYSQPIDNEVFRLMKRVLPGAYTFVINSNNKVPRLFKNRKKTIGVRIPDNTILQHIVETLGRPILTASLRSDDEIAEYFTDPIDIYDDYQKLVDIVIDGGIGKNVASTVLDCTGNEVVVLRQGAGEL
jgi:tRNA threonylcarbamoyl adenosine modification protein (Sua5/YciO/YrdC/YwlC family)